MTTALITGVGGSIGCHVLRQLLAGTDWNLVGIGSFRNRGLTDRVEVVLQERPAFRHRVRVFVHDLRVPLSTVLINKIGPVDYIINLAALSDVGVSLADPGSFIVGNTQMAVNVLDYARVVKPRSFLHFSTDEVYGPKTDRMHREWDTILPSSPYSASKAAQEAAAYSYWRSFGVPLVIANCSNNFGEMQSALKFPSIVQRKLARGEQVVVHATEQGIGRRTYIYSGHVATAVQHLLEHHTPRMHVEGVADRPSRFNITSGWEPVANDALVKIIANIMKVPANFVIEQAAVSRPGYDPEYGLSGNKLADHGWACPLDFPDKLTQVVQWHQRHPEWLDPR